MDNICLKYLRDNKDITISDLEYIKATLRELLIKQCRDFLDQGYIYIMNNDMYDNDTYKIGKTKNLDERKKKFTTSYVTNSEIIYATPRVKNYHFLEKLVFHFLKNFKIRNNREFFRGNLEEIKNKINYCVGLLNNSNEIEIFEKHKVKPHSINGDLYLKYVSSKLFNETDFFLSMIKAKTKIKTCEYCEKIVDAHHYVRHLRTCAYKKIITEEKYRIKANSDDAEDYESKYFELKFDYDQIKNEYEVLKNDYIMVTRKLLKDTDQEGTS